MEFKRDLFRQWILITLPFFMFSCITSKGLRKAQHELLSDKTIYDAHIGISIYDVEDGKYIFDHQGDKYFVPASNTKIASCYAAMKYLGDSLTAFNYLEKGDTIVIEGTGSPDLLHTDFKQQDAINFLKRFRHVVIATQSYDEFLGNGWAWNDYQDYYMTQRSELPLYGNITTFKWNENGTVTIIPSLFRQSSATKHRSKYKSGFDVQKAFETNYFTITDGTRQSAEVPFSPGIEDIKDLLADTLRVPVSLTNEKLDHKHRFKSRPLDAVLTSMMHRSDNFFAEQILLMVSQQQLGKMSDAAIIDTLLKTDLSFLSKKPEWVDGSGLSRYNLFTPKNFIGILNKIREEFGMERVKTIFPTGGEGTLGNYYKEEQGMLFAKTGTLSGVVALSGYLYTKQGKLLLFSVLVNNHNGPATDVRKAVEKFLRKVRDTKK